MKTDETDSYKGTSMSKIMHGFCLCTVTLALLVLAGCAGTSRGKNISVQEADTTFTNPVIYADVPDVDVIRTGGDYYMVSTTMHLSPGAPIMHSKDLVHWNTVSYLFDTLDESPENDLDGGNIYGRGQWAASLRYHRGTYYAFFGTGNKSYIYTAQDPAGKWERKLTLDRYYHDASMLFDDDGRIYLVYGSGHVRIIELREDLSGVKDDGLNVEIISGEPKGLLEGAHFYKFNGKYYITFIWWPQGGIRTQLCYRSDKVEGPYESKVILSDDLGYAGHGVAQGCLVDTEKGDAWYAMLFQDHEAVGRVPVLVPCRWEDGWPVLGDADGRVPVRMNKPVQGIPGKTELVKSDDFDGGKLGLNWQWNHNPDNSFWSLTERKGFLRLKTGKVVGSLFDARNTLTQRTEGPHCMGVVALDVSHMKDGDRAGLSAFSAQAGVLAVVKEDGRLFLSMTDRGEEKARVPLGDDRVYLKVECDFTTDDAQFYYSLDNKDWTPMGGKFHMVYTLQHFMGYRFAIFNYATQEVGGYVDVDFFRFGR